MEFQTLPPENAPGAAAEAGLSGRGIGDVSRIERLVGRVPNPLSLAGWAIIFRVTGLLSLIWLVLSPAFTLPIARRLSCWAGSGYGTGYEFTANQLRVGIECLILLAVADLLRNLAGREERLRLGRHVAFLLWARAAVDGLLAMVVFFIPKTDLHFLVGLMCLGQGLFYATAGLVAFRFIPQLMEGRDHALPSEGHLLYASQRITPGPGPLGRFLPRLLIAVGVLPALVGTVAVIVTVPEVLQSWIMADPPGTIPGGTSPAREMLSMAQVLLLPGLLLICLAGWSQSFRRSSGWRRRLGDLLPLVFWALVATRGFLLLVRLNYPYGTTGIALIFPVLEALIWMLPFVGAGYAVRTITRLSRDTG